MKSANNVTRYGPLHFETKGFVSIWVAVSPLNRIPEDYFEERYDDDDEQPLTQFYADFGFGYFDHDFMDTNGSKEDAAPIEKLLGACSYASSFLDQAVAQARNRGLETTQHAVLLYNFKYDPQQTGITKNAYMEFIGSFPYNEAAPNATHEDS